MSSRESAGQPANKMNRAALRDRYGYISGRVRVLEMQLLDSSRLNRLLEARSQDDILRVLAECGYPQSPDPETSLSHELEAVYNLLRAHMPEPEFVEALMVFHDVHNVKVVLKHLGTPAMDADEAENAAGQPVPELNQVAESLTQALTRRGGLDLYLRRPSLVPVEMLVRSITEHKPDLLPSWLDQAASAAFQRYKQTYDFGETDLVLDQAAWAEVLRRAAVLECPFFSRYLQIRIDCINLDLLLRTRFLRSGADFLEKALISGGSVDRRRILPLYQAENEAIRAAYEQTRYAELAGLSTTYGKSGSAARFSLLADNLVMSLVREATRVVSGPDVALAYLLAREMEIKNIRVILTSRRNGLSQTQAREMTRINYLAWR